MSLIILFQFQIFFAFILHEIVRTHLHYDYLHRPGEKHTFFNFQIIAQVLNFVPLGLGASPECLQYLYEQQSVTVHVS